jgi:tight adherence protein C
MELVLAGLVFGCVFLVVMGLQSSLRPRTAGRRLEGLAGAGSGEPPARASMIRQEGQGWLLGTLHRLGAQRASADERGQMRTRMIHAGYPSPLAPGIFYGVRLVLAIALPLLASTMPALWGLTPLAQIISLCGLAATAYILPSAWIDSRLKRRKGTIERTLPDALDLMVVCVEAGFGINQALARVSDEFAVKSPVLAREFGLVVMETRAGKSSTEALRSLAERTGVSDVSCLVALLVQTERFGTSVATALRVHADSMRIRRMQRAEERAQKATLKLILPSIMIFVALMVIFMAPGMYRFYGAFSAE